MGTYYVAYALMLMFGIWRLLNTRELQNRKSRKRYCIFFAIIWIYIMGLRHPSMGIDLDYGGTRGYLGQYEVISQMSWQEVRTEQVQNYQRGYIIFNKAISYFSDDPQFLLFACALISIGVVAFWVYRYSDYPMLSTFIYLGLPVFMINYSAIRQSIAVPITLIAFETIRRKKLVWFVLLVSLAASFHASAWIFLAAYPLYWVKMSQRWSKLSIGFPFVVYAFRHPLFNILSKMFKDDAVAVDNGAVTLFLVFCAVYIFAVLFEDKEDPDELGMRNLFLLACICQAFSDIYNTAMRVGYYFMIYAALLLPRIIRNTDKKPVQERERDSTMILYMPILICFFAFGLYSVSKESWAMSNPHTFFWQ